MDFVRAHWSRGHHNKPTLPPISGKCGACSCARLPALQIWTARCKCPNHTYPVSNQKCSRMSVQEADAFTVLCR